MQNSEKQPRRYRGKDGRIYEAGKAGAHLYWSQTMLDMLRRYYATTSNKEMGDMLGMSSRTVCRKAKEMGLEKSRAYLLIHLVDNCRIMNIKNKQNGNPTQFKKGVRSNPEGEFKKGHKLSEETRAKWLKNWRAALEAIPEWKKRESVEKMKATKARKRAEVEQNGLSQSTEQERLSLH